jgi:hypothetical protein
MVLCIASATLQNKLQNKKQLVLVLLAAMRRARSTPIALEPPPTHAKQMSGLPPNCSMHCCLVSLPITAWNSRTCTADMVCCDEGLGHTMASSRRGDRLARQGARCPHPAFHEVRMTHHQTQDNGGNGRAEGAHNSREGVGSGNRPQNVVGVFHVGDPVADGGAASVLQGLGALVHTPHLCPQ